MEFHEQGAKECVHPTSGSQDRSEIVKKSLAADYKMKCFRQQLFYLKKVTDSGYMKEIWETMRANDLGRCLSTNEYMFANV